MREHSRRRVSNASVADRVSNPAVVKSRASMSARTRGASRGFTLVEVMVAVALLALSLSSLLSSQMASLRATRYAQEVSAVSFLAEAKLIDIEWQSRIDGWVSEDQNFDGDFSEEGWPDVRYECVIDFIELPDYSELARAADAMEGETGGGSSVDAYDSGEQAFDAIGMAWPIVKGAIEQSIRKASCTARWGEGEVEHDFTVATFWTDPSKLQQLPQLGGEASDDDAMDDDDGGGVNPPGGGPGGPGGRPGGGRPGVLRE